MIVARLRLRLELDELERGGVSGGQIENRGAFVIAVEQELEGATLEVGRRAFVVDVAAAESWEWVEGDAG